MFLINRIKKTFTRGPADDRASTAPSTGPGSFRRAPANGGAQSDRNPQRPHSSFSGPGGQEAANTSNGPFQQARAAAAASSSRQQQPHPSQVQAQQQQQLAMQQAAAAAAARKKKFEDLIPVIGDGPITAFCSTKWQERVEGLDTVGRMLRAKMHAKRVMGDDKGIALHFSNVCKLLHRALSDKVTPVYFALVDLLNVTVECGLPKSDAAVQDGLRPLFPGMIKWMSVNNSRVQEKTLRAFVDFAQNERIGVKFIAPMALPAYRSEKPSQRVVEARMTLLLGLLPVGSPADFPADAVMKLCMPALESGDEKLRNMGVAVAAEAYRHHGKAVPVHTRHLPAGVLRLLDKKFVAIDKAKAAADDPSTPAAMDDDPLWLLRIQKNVGASNGSMGDVHGPAQEAAGIAPRVTPRDRGTGAGMGAGAGAGFGARVTQPAQPRFKGHDWSKGPPVRRAGPAVAAARGSGVDTSRFVAPPSTTSAFGGGGAGNGGGAGEPSRSRAGSTGGGLGAAGARTLGTNGSPDGAGGAGMGANTWGGRRAGGGGGGGVSDGAGDTRRTSATRTTRTAAFGARIMGAGPSGIGASPALGGGDAERPRRREGGRDGGWGGASHGTGGGGGGGARKWGTNNRSVLSNTGAATFGSPVPKQAAPGPEGPATSSFLPNLGDERPKRRNMDDDDEALMDDILSNL